MTITKGGWYGTDKYTQMWDLHVAFLSLWIGVGTFLGVYVRSQMKEASQKTSYCMMTFWLTGLAVFFMWLLWFSVYAAQLNV